jgi:hypothetical protein
MGSGCGSGSRGQGVVEIPAGLGDLAVVLVVGFDAQPVDDGLEGVGQAGQVAALALADTTEGTS